MAITNASAAQHTIAVHGRSCARCTATAAVTIRAEWNSAAVVPGRDPFNMICVWHSDAAPARAKLSTVMAEYTTCHSAPHHHPVPVHTSMAPVVHKR